MPPTTKPKQAPPAQTDKESDLEFELRSLCYAVSHLDDAGLDVFAKSVIRRARALVKKIEGR